MKHVVSHYKVVLQKYCLGEAVGQKLPWTKTGSDSSGIHHLNSHPKGNITLECGLEANIALGSTISHLTMLSPIIFHSAIAAILELHI